MIKSTLARGNKGLIGTIYLLSKVYIKLTVDGEIIQIYREEFLKDVS